MRGQAKKKDLTLISVFTNNVARNVKRKLLKKDRFCMVVNPREKELHHSKKLNRIQHQQKRAPPLSLTHPTYLYMPTTMSNWNISR